MDLSVACLWGCGLKMVFLHFCGEDDAPAFGRGIGGHSAGGTSRMGYVRG